MYNADTTPKAPRLCTYIESTLNNERQNRPKPIRAVYNTPHEAFPLLCSWQLLLELPDSYTVKTKAYSYALYVYMSAQTSAHWGFRYGYRRYKDNTFILETTLFCQ